MCKRGRGAYSGRRLCKVRVSRPRRHLGELLGRWLHGGYMAVTWWLHGGYMASPRRASRAAGRRGRSRARTWAASTRRSDRSRSAPDERGNRQAIRCGGTRREVLWSYAAAIAHATSADSSCNQRRSEEIIINHEEPEAIMRQQKHSHARSAGWSSGRRPRAASGGGRARRGARRGRAAPGEGGAPCRVG